MKNKSLTFALGIALALSMEVQLSGQEAVIDNGLVSRAVNCADGHVRTLHYNVSGSDRSLLRPGSREFSILVNDKFYTGDSDWKDITVCDAFDERSGSGCTISFKEPSGAFSIDLTYLAYPDLPLVRKFLSIANQSDEDLKVEAVYVEDILLNCSSTESWTFRQYGRYKEYGAYEGNYDDALVIVHNYGVNNGIALGNETVGVLKHTTTFEDGASARVGVTRPDDDFPFRRWVKPGCRWTSAGAFTAPYSNERDPYKVINTTVQEYVRKYLGTRVEQISHKPMFVYDTWVPFRSGINEELIKDVAKAAAECGVGEFVIDDGWEYNIDAPGSPTFRGDWVYDPKKFPDGLKPVFDYIKSLGMKPGLWVSLATADRVSQAYKNHPEWFVRDKEGKITDLHNTSASSASATACMGTDWYDNIRDVILGMIRDFGLAYVKLDLAIVTSAYVYDHERSGCHATDHPYHKDWQESLSVIYERAMQLFDELHREAPDLYIDCTYETAGKNQLMDYGLAMHADGNWLSNVYQPAPTGPLRVRSIGWGRCPALPATSLVVGNLRMDDPLHILNFKSLTGTLPVMLGDPRTLSPEEKAEFKAYSTWLEGLQERHSYMSFRQDLPGTGEPASGSWDGFCRLNTETGSGGLIAIFREGSPLSTRTVTVNGLKPEKEYVVRHGPYGEVILKASGAELSRSGFQVTIDEEYGGELFEIEIINDRHR